MEVDNIETLARVAITAITTTNPIATEKALLVRIRALETMVRIINGYRDLLIYP